MPRPIVQPKLVHPLEERGQLALGPPRPEEGGYCLPGNPAAAKLEGAEAVAGELAYGGVIDEQALPASG